MNKNWLEWGMFGISCCIIMTILGVLIVDSSTINGKPPLLTIELGPVEEHAQQYLLPFTIQNIGDQTAENVVIEVTAGAEKTEMTIAFVPRGSQRAGWIVFEQPPQQPTGRILGYEEP